MSQSNKFFSLNRRWFLRSLAFAGGAAVTLPLTQWSSLVRAKTQGSATSSATILQDLDSVPNPSKPLKVVILGAGMAGLAAAYELEKRGHKCVILEADRTHIGGRVRTLRFDNGLYGEVGAMRIPQTHNLTHHYIDVCGLQVRQFVMDNPQTYYYMRGQRIRAKDKARLPSIYGLTGSESSLTPDDVWDKVVGSRLKQLTEQQKAEILTEYSTSTIVREMDAQSVLQACKNTGLSDNAIEMMLAAKGLLGDQAYYSLLSTVRLVEAEKTKLTEIVGGMDQLPAALADKLKSKPRMGCEVIGLERADQTQKATAVYIQNGITQREEGDFILCTIPFPVLSRLDTPFDANKKKAIRDLSYDSSTKMLALANRRFWETGDGIYGGGSFTDLPIISTYYPSDNAQAKDPKVSASPGVLLASYTWASESQRLEYLPENKRDAVVQQCLSKIHPQVNQQGVLQQMVSWSWDTHPWSLGAFCFFRPYQQMELYQDAIAPSGRIHFAGEHTSVEYAWIQGALASSLRAVKEMLVAARS